MQERVFMGIGNKPFMDIQPSDAAINDRAVNYVPMGRGKQKLPVKNLKELFITLTLITRNCDIFSQSFPCHILS